LASLLAQQQQRGAPHAEPLHQGDASSSGGLAQLLELHGGHEPASEPGDTDPLMRRLKEHFGVVDAAQAATLALLLGALAKREAAGLHAGAAADGGLLTAGRPFQQLGQPIPESHWGDFEPALCARLQNFGGAEGYRAMYLGNSPCAAAGNAASGQFIWGSEASFTAECRLEAAEVAPAPAAGAAAPSTVAGRIQAAAAKAADNFSAALQRSMRCSLAIASAGGAGTGDPGSGAIVRHTRGVQLLGGAKLNAVRIRVCNM
jgi:hypothetical protein